MNTPRGQPEEKIHERERELELREQESQRRSEVMLAEAAALRAAARVDLARAAQAMAAEKIHLTPRGERMRIRESPASALRDEIEALMRAKGGDAALLGRVSRAFSEHDSTDHGSSSSSSILSSIPHRDDSDPIDHL
jgi:hypothetical protein